MPSASVFTIKARPFFKQFCVSSLDVDDLNEICTRDKENVPLMYNTEILYCVYWVYVHVLM